MKIRMLVTDGEIPNDYLNYDVVLLASDDIVLHSRKATEYLKGIITDTKLYCHKCFMVFNTEEEYKNHQCIFT